MHRVVGIGSAVFDFQMLINSYPVEDTKLEASTTRAVAGGPCATALVTMSKLGLEPEYMGTLGSDSFGLGILEDFKSYNVGVDNIRVIENCQSFHAAVLINPENATRTCVWNRGTVPAPETSDVNLEAVRASDYLYLDGHQYKAAVYAAKAAKKSGVKIVLDAGGLYEGIEEIVDYTDILIPSEEFALKYSGCETVESAAVEIYKRHKPEVLVITQGSRGGIIYQDGKVTQYPAFKVKAVDTNGAGDVFHGAFVAAHARGLSGYDCAVFASAVSAIKCQGFGAREAVPYIADVTKFLEERDFNVRF